LVERPTKVKGYLEGMGLNNGSFKLGNENVEGMNINE